MNDVIVNPRLRLVRCVRRLRYTSDDNIILGTIQGVQVMFYNVKFGVKAIKRANTIEIIVSVTFMVWFNGKARVLNHKGPVYSMGTDASKAGFGATCEWDYMWGEWQGPGGRCVHEERPPTELYDDHINEQEPGRCWSVSNDGVRLIVIQLCMP